MLCCSPPTPDSGLSLQALMEASDYAVTDEEAETSGEETGDQVMEAARSREAAEEPDDVPVVRPRLRGHRLRVTGPSAAMLAASAAARRERMEPLRVRTMPQGGARPVIAISPSNIVEPEDSSEESGEEELQVFRAGRRSN